MPNFFLDETQQQLELSLLGNFRLNDEHVSSFCATASDLSYAKINNLPRPKNEQKLQQSEAKQQFCKSDPSLSTVTQLFQKPCYASKPLKSCYADLLSVKLVKKKLVDVWYFCFGVFKNVNVNK